MKKLLLIMLASFFMLMSCDIAGDDEDSSSSSATDFIGTWISGTETYVFTASTFTYNESVLSTSYEGTVSVSSDQLTIVTTELTMFGTTYTGDELTAVLTELGTTSTTTYTYSVDGDTLTLTRDDSIETFTMLSEISEEDDDEIVYTTLTKEYYDIIALYLDVIWPSDDGYDDIYKEYDEETTSINGIGYSGSVTSNEDVLIFNLITIFTDETAYTKDGEIFTYNGTFTYSGEESYNIIYDEDTDEPISGTDSDSHELIYDISFTNADISYIKGNINTSSSYTAEDMKDDDYEEDYTSSGFINIDGKNYKASEISYYEDYDEDDD